MSSRTVPLLKTAVYQEVKYIVIGTAMISRVVIAGNVTTLATGLRMTAATRLPTAGWASISRVIGLPIIRNSGETSTSSTVWVARA